MNLYFIKKEKHISPIKFIKIKKKILCIYFITYMYISFLQKKNKTKQNNEI